MYVYICIYMYVCIYICMYIYVYILRSCQQRGQKFEPLTSSTVSNTIKILSRECVLDLHVDYICVYICVHIYICIYVCVIYIYICIYMYIYCAPERRFGPPRRLYNTICVLILLYVSSYCHICVLILLYMCPHATIYVSSYCCPHTTSTHTYTGVLDLRIESMHVMCNDEQTFRPLVLESFVTACNKKSCDATSVLLREELQVCGRMLTYADVC